MEALLSALGLMLVFEGLLPLVAPRRWRGVFEQLLQLHNGQIRFYGAVSVGLGLILLWVLS